MRYEIIIKAISISNAWHALYLTKQGTFGFLANPANKIINNKKLPKGKDFSIIAIGKVSNNSILLKKNICKTNNIQKVLMPLTAKYTKILMRVSGKSDSIYCLSLVFIF